MNVDELIDNFGWPIEFKRVLLKFMHNIPTLNPLQTDFVQKESLKEDRFVVSAPTAFSKTLLAVLDILHRLKEGYSTFIYLLPRNITIPSVHSDMK